MTDTIRIVEERVYVRVPDGDQYQVVIVEETPIIKVVNGGLELASDIVAALNAANAPSAANAFATLADLPAGYPFPVTVVSNWATPTGCAYDLQQAGIQITRDGVSNIVISMQTIIAGHYDHAVVSVVSDGVHVPSTTYKVAWNTTPAVGAVVYVTAALQINPATAAELSAHTTGVDPHGDRAYAAGLGANYDAAGSASTAVANHVGATDPHGDRAYANGLVGLKLPIDIPVLTDGLPAWSVTFSLADVLGDLFGTLIPWSNEQSEVRL